MNVMQIREARNPLLAEMEALAKRGEQEKRKLTKDELARFDDLEKQDEKLVSQIKQAEAQEAVKPAPKYQPKSAYVLRGDAASKNAKYNPVAILQAGLEDRALNGFEAEYHAEHNIPERSKNGGRILPWDVLGVREINALTRGTSGEGAEFADDRFSTPVLPLYADMPSSQLGVRRIVGIDRDVEIPVFDRSTASGSWLAETASTNELEPTSAVIKTSPSRIGGFVQVSNTLLTSAGQNDVMGWLQTFLRSVVAENIELAFWRGTGSNNQPKGVIPSLEAAQTIAGGTNGDPLSRTKTLSAVRMVQDANSFTERRGWAINPRQEQAAKNIVIDSGSGRFLLQNGMLDEQRYASSTILPSDASKGTGRNLSTIVWGGDWNDVAQIFYGAGINILTDIYSARKTSQVILHAEAFADVRVLRAKSFVKLTDLT